MKFGKFILSIFTFGLIACQANPDNLKYERNYLKGLEISAELNKPILIHFTGWGCVSYDEFKYDLITSREIQERLNNEFVTVQLYVDDRNEIQVIDTMNLHKIEFTEKGKERIRKAKTIGNINAVIETDLFESNSQPLYVIIDSKRNILIEPFGYTHRNRKYFLAKLDEGIRKFKKKK